MATEFRILIFIKNFPIGIFRIPKFSKGNSEKSEIKFSYEMSEKMSYKKSAIEKDREITVVFVIRKSLLKIRELVFSPLGDIVNIWYIWVRYTMILYGGSKNFYTFED